MEKLNETNINISIDGLSTGDAQAAAELLALAGDPAKFDNVSTVDTTDYNMDENPFDVVMDEEPVDNLPTEEISVEELPAEEMPVIDEPTVDDEDTEEPIEDTDESVEEDIDDVEDPVLDAEDKDELLLEEEPIESDEDIELIAENDPIEDIGDLIEDGASDSEDIDECIQDVCSIIGVTLNEASMGKLMTRLSSKLEEGFVDKEAEEKGLFKIYRVIKSNGMEKPEFKTAFNVMNKFVNNKISLDMAKAQMDALSRRVKKIAPKLSFEALQPQEVESSKFEDLFVLHANGNDAEYMKVLDKLSDEEKSAYIAWAEEKHIPQEDLHLNLLTEDKPMGLLDSGETSVGESLKISDMGKLVEDLRKDKLSNNEINEHIKNMFEIGALTNEEYNEALKYVKESINPKFAKNTKPNPVLKDNDEVGTVYEPVETINAWGNETPGFEPKGNQSNHSNIVKVVESAKKTIEKADPSLKDALIRRFAGKLLDEGVCYADATEIINKIFL